MCASGGCAEGADCPGGMKAFKVVIGMNRVSQPARHFNADNIGGQQC
jgi:hypothetical protein